MRPLSFGMMLCAALLIGCGKKPKSIPSENPPPSPMATPTQPATANDPQASEQLRGAWHVISIEASGKPIPADRVQNLGLQYVFNGNTLTVRRPGRPDDVKTITVDASANPKKLTSTGKPPIRAIYAVEGTKLRLCLMVDENPNAGYPTEFASKASPASDLLILERR